MIKISSQFSLCYSLSLIHILGTVCSLLETQENRDLSESELKSREEIEEELDLQWQIYRLLKDRKSTRLNSSHIQKSRMPSSA